MTTAAYKDGLLIADTRAYGFDRMYVGRKCKVTRLHDGRLVAISTIHLGQPARVLSWIEDGMDRDKAPDMLGALEVIVVNPDGSADLMNDSLRPSRVEARHYAIGSGKEFAATAMHLGLGAAEAVGVACELDVWTDFPLEGYTHAGKQVTVKNMRALRRAK